MKIFISVIVMFFAFTANASTATEACSFNGQSILEGDTVYVEDPTLIKQAKDYYLSNGYSDEQASKHAASSDWVGFVLVCQRTFTFNESIVEKASKPTEMLSYGPLKLVLIDHQVEWFSRLRNKGESDD